MSIMTKRVLPSVVRRQIAMDRRHRRLEFLHARRGETYRYNFREAGSTIADAWDRIAIAMAPAIAAMRELPSLDQDEEV